MQRLLASSRAVEVSCMLSLFKRASIGCNGSTESANLAYIWTADVPIAAAIIKTTNSEAASPSPLIMKTAGTRGHCNREEAAFQTRLV